MARSSMPVKITLRTALVGFLAVAAGLLALLSTLVWWTGIHVALGSFQLLPSPSHLLFRSAVVLLAASLLRREDERRLPRFLVLVAFLFVSAILDSPTRQVGDGHEYLAMAHNLAALRPPSVTASDIGSLRSEVLKFEDQTWAGLDAAMGTQALNPNLVGHDGRYDFAHFWLMPLLAAPLVALVEALHLHPATGFIAFNLACLALLVTVLVQRAGRYFAVLVASVLLWWIDKVHPEVFFFTSLAVGLLWLDEHPAAALILLGFGVAQMPVFAPLLIMAVALTMWRQRRTPQLWAAVVGSAALLTVYPAYYFWHLSRISPLDYGAAPYLLNIRLLATPLTDLNLGIVWYAPILSCLSLAGLLGIGKPCSRATMVIGGIAAIALVVVAAQTSNVNHGATPGPSRYGLWCLALLTPMAVNAAHRLTQRRDALSVAAVFYTLLFSTVLMHPRVTDRSAPPFPTALAAAVWTRFPNIENPVPEVFAERIAHSDGAPIVPTATAGCEKVLLIGDGRSVWWPAWCDPVRVPITCAEDGPSCYWNDGTVAAAPKQAAFAWRRATDGRKGPGGSP